jgi:hypothetical protein
MRYSDYLYCTHPYHVTRNNNRPEKIDKETFKKKKCGDKHLGGCRWLVCYKIPPVKRTDGEIKRDFREKAKSKQSLIHMCKDKNGQIKNLKDEIIELSKDKEYYKKRYEKLLAKLSSVGFNSDSERSDEK